MIHVVVIIWKGNLEDIAAFNQESDAIKYFSQEAHVPWEEYTKRRCDGEDTDTILGDYAGCNIWELNIQ